MLELRHLTKVTFSTLRHRTGKFFSQFVFTRYILGNVTNDCVFITKVLMMGVKVMTEV